MNSNSIFTRRHAGADAAASVSAPATTSAAAEDAFKNDPTATLEGVRGKDVTKAAKALLKDSVKRGGIKIIHRHPIDLLGNLLTQTVRCFLRNSRHQISLDKRTSRSRFQRCLNR